MKDIKIIVAAHKPYEMPNDKMYLPIHVGAEGKDNIGFQRDDSGINISEKNYSFCELTGLYWAWKNIDFEYLGLVHYRRHFKNNKGKANFSNVLKQKKLEEVLSFCDVVLPKKRRYFIESNRSQYLHAHHPEGLKLTEQVISEKYPEYMQSFDTVMRKTSGHKFNMLIMKKEVLNSYCDWLFDILFTVEERLDISEWSKQEQRVFGYLAERLLDVWIFKNKIKYLELDYMFMEKQNLLKKGLSFLKRKFFGAKKKS